MAIAPMAKRRQKFARRNPHLDKRIGRRIRKERLRRNLAIRQVADQAGMSTSQLSQVELGKNAASIWALVRIAKALRLHVTKLLSDV